MYNVPFPVSVMLPPQPSPYEVTHPVKMTMIFAGYFSDTEVSWEDNVYTKEGDSAKYAYLKSTKNDGTVTYCYYELKKYNGFDKGYLGVKKEELSFVVVRRYTEQWSCSTVITPFSSTAADIIFSIVPSS